MKTQFVILFFLLLPLHFCFACKGDIKVLVIDGYSNHDWSYTTEVITAILTWSGCCEVDITTAPLNNTPGYNAWRPDFAKYDVVVQNTNSFGNNNYWPELARSDFEKYMKKGGGMYVFHSANNAFEQWEEYDKMIGLGWRKADHGYAVEIKDGKPVKISPGEGSGTSHGPRRTLVVETFKDHPVNEGYSKKWMTPDIELYTYVRGPAENLHVLSYTYDSITGKNWPVDWVVAYGKGRVYNATFGHIGHDNRIPQSIQCVGFRTTFIRAIQWLAGKRVSTEIPFNFPTESEISLESLDIVYRKNDGWENLYNGYSLDGWHVRCLPSDKDRTFWKAMEGYIECNSLDQTNHGAYWLINDKQYDDFQLRLEFQVFEKSKGNSGLQFRSRYDELDEKSGSGWMNGPQVGIQPSSSLQTGLIYDKTKEVQRWIHPSLPGYVMGHESAPAGVSQSILVYADNDPEAWNSLELICKDMQIRTFVNGRRVVRFDASGILDDNVHRNHDVGTRGYIAFELPSRSELLIRFRNIYIREMVHELSNR